MHRGKIGAAFNPNLLALSSPSGRRTAEQGSDGIFALRRPGIRLVLEMLIVELLATLDVSGRPGLKTLCAAGRVVIKLRGGLRLRLRRLALSGAAARGTPGEEHTRQQK
jgi:hypothetical protein